VVALGLAALLDGSMLRDHVQSLTGSLPIYAATFFVVVLRTVGPGLPAAGVPLFELLYFAGMAAAIGLSIRLAPNSTFDTTPLDYLALFTMALLAYVPFTSPLSCGGETVFVEGFILLYGRELPIRHF